MTVGLVYPASEKGQAGYRLRVLGNLKRSTTDLQTSIVKSCRTIEQLLRRDLVLIATVTKRHKVQSGFNIDLLCQERMRFHVDYALAKH